MSIDRVITKYPNRRLYDSGDSRYVTLDDIRRLVLSRTDFRVIDRKTGNDITRSILLQVITELEQGGEGMMSRDFLAQVIRSYGKVVPDMAAEFLEQSMKFFVTQQQNFRAQVRRMIGCDPFSAVADAAQKNISRWKQLQEEVLGRFVALYRAGERDADPTPGDQATA